MMSNRTNWILCFVVVYLLLLNGSMGYRVAMESTSTRRERRSSHQTVKRMESNEDDNIVPIDPTAIFASLFPMIEEQSKHAKEETDDMHGRPSQSHASFSESEEVRIVPPKISIPTILTTSEADSTTDTRSEVDSTTETGSGVDLTADTMSEVDSTTETGSGGDSMPDADEESASGGMFGEVMPMSPVASQESMGMMLPKMEAVTVIQPSAGLSTVVTPPESGDESEMVPIGSPKEITELPAEKMAMASIPMHDDTTLEDAPSSGAPTEVPQEEEEKSDAPEVTAVGSASSVEKEHSVMVPIGSPKEIMKHSEEKMAMASIPAHDITLEDAPSSTAPTEALQEGEEISDAPEVTEIGSASSVEKEHSVMTPEEAAVSSERSPESPLSSEVLTEDQPQREASPSKPEASIEEPSSIASPSSESAPFKADDASSSKAAESELQSKTKILPVDKIEKDSSIEADPKTPSLETSHRSLEKPLHLASTEQSVTDPFRDTKGSSVQTNENKHSDGISHEAKFVLWLIAGVCLSLIIVGNAFGIYLTYIQPRLRRSPSIDLFVLDV